MNLFTRDNTNDGGGWDVRLSHIIPTGQYGYPSLFAHFNDEIVQPLADYGGGSPTGSLYLQEPGFPAGFGDTLYTCEWGRSGVFRHPLDPKGAGFKAQQEPFLDDAPSNRHGRRRSVANLCFELARRRIHVLEAGRRLRDPRHLSGRGTPGLPRPQIRHR